MLVRAAKSTAQAPGRQPAPLGSTGTEVALAGRAREPHPVQEEDPACAGAGSEELFPRVQELHHRHRVLVHAAFPAEVRLAQALRLPAAELCTAVHEPERSELIRRAPPRPAATVAAEGQTPAFARSADASLRPLEEA